MNRKNDGFVNQIYLIASILDPNYGFVWLENDLPISVTVKDAVQHKVIDAIIREAESVCISVSNVVMSYMAYVRQQFITPTVDKWNALQRESKFDILHKLLEMVFCAPATSVPVFRVFNHSGLFMRPNRARLGDKMLADLVFLKCNKNLKLTAMT